MRNLREYISDLNKWNGQNQGATCRLIRAVEGYGGSVPYRSGVRRQGGVHRGQSMIRVVVVDARGERIVVQSYSRTVDGLNVLNGWFKRLPVDVDAGTLGAAVREALDRTGDRHPRADREQRQAMLQALQSEMGVRSYSTYLKGARSVTVTVADPGTVITVTPMVNGGTSGPTKGFTFNVEAEVTIPNAATDEELGRAVTQAFAVAT